MFVCGFVDIDVRGLVLLLRIANSVCGLIVFGVVGCGVAFVRCCCLLAVVGVRVGVVVCCCCLCVVVGCCSVRRHCWLFMFVVVVVCCCCSVGRAGVVV